MKKVHLPWKVLGVAFSLCREFCVFANSIRIAPWLWHIFFRGIGCCTVQNFAQSLPCHTTHMKKAPLLWQVPKGMRYHWYRRQRAAVSRSTICLLGVGFSLCRVVFALGQAKFCVFANFIRIARLFWHFPLPRGIGYFYCFLALYSSACNKYVKLARGLWLLNVPVLINFPCGKRLKKHIIHTGILDFLLLAAQFPQSVPATANGSQTWFVSNADERQE